MKRKFIPYGRQFIGKEEIKEVVKVLRSDFITQGPKVEEFERALANYCGAKYAVVVSSGTAALHLACLAAGIKKGDEVITSPITFVASANSVIYCGGKPVFADIQEDTVNISPEEIRKKITKRTKAIIPVDFAGHPCDIQEIYKIAKKNNLTVIEDACHALGAEYKSNGEWIKVGSCIHSDMTVFSFHPVKSITTGEGGAILTNNKKIYEKLKILRHHGIVKVPSKGGWYYRINEIGYNYRITDFQCTLGIAQLKKLDEFIRNRREIVSIYNRSLSNIKEIELPREKDYVKSSWHIYYIRLNNTVKRKLIFEKLRKANIGVQVHYIPVHLQPYYKKIFGYREGMYPKAENYYKSTITIPLYCGLKKGEIDYIVKFVKRAFNYA